MKSWVIVLLVVLALLLILLGLREGFEATELIKDPATWDTAEYSRIRAMVTPISTANDNDIKEIVGGFFAKWKEEDYRITMDEVRSYISSKGVMPDRRAEFTDMVKAYYIDQGQSVFQQAAGYVSSFVGENTAGQFSTPTCPTDYTLATDGTGKCKYKDNTMPPIEPTCPSGSTLTFDNPPRCRNPNATAPTEESTSTTPPTSIASTPAPVPTSNTSAPEEYTDPICPTGTSLDARKRCIYPGEPQMITCPSGYTPTAGGVCRKIGSMEEIPGQCPSGHIREGLACIRTEQPTCPSGYTFRSVESGNTCFRLRGSTAGTTAGTPGAAATSSGTTTGNTTGGASTSSFGPNSGSGTGGAVWGPAFTSFGSLLGGSTGDSTQSTQYPILLGGLGNASTRMEGAGITQPSSSWQLSLSGQLPSSGSLGSDANSQFLPYSRTPGDQDIIPDPFRVSQQFSAASYSSRPEPTPFLTDFSAFLA
jgi:hypothetical protein